MTFLEDKRKEIADTDREIMALLKKRLDLAKEIGEYKAENGMEVVDPRVEERVVARYRLLADDSGFDPDRAEAIARTLIAESVENELELQRGEVSVSKKKRAEVEDDEDEPDVPSAPHEPVTGRAREKAYLLLAVGVALSVVLAVATYFVGSAQVPDELGTLFGMMALPIVMVAVAFGLSTWDILRGDGSDYQFFYYSRRAAVFGSILIAISVIILVLLSV